MGSSDDCYSHWQNLAYSFSVLSVSMRGCGFVTDSVAWADWILQILELDPLLYFYLEIISPGSKFFGINVQIGKWAAPQSCFEIWAVDTKREL